MKNAVVSLAAVLMVLASFATPSFAADNPNYQGQKFNASITVPDTVQAGQSFTARASITVLNDGSNASRKMVAYRLSTDLGTANRSGFRAFPVGRTKSLTKAYTVPDRLEAGDYTITLAIQVEGETALLTRTIHVTK
jgi:hypothetical protein